MKGSYAFTFACRPFPYPGHTYIPLTLEKSCLQLDVVPHDQRKEEVTVLGKLYGESFLYMESPHRRL